jgi:hypothetical protein
VTKVIRLAAATGRKVRARPLVFEKMYTCASHLGLYSEEIGATGEQLGNFPQAFSHLSLISAAINHGPGIVGKAIPSPRPAAATAADPAPARR